MLILFILLLLLLLKSHPEIMGEYCGILYNYDLQSKTKIIWTNLIRTLYIVGFSNTYTLASIRCATSVSQIVTNAHTAYAARRMLK